MSALAVIAFAVPSAAATPSSQARNVQQISRSTLPASGAEADTETESAVAIDPSHAADATAVFQVNRFSDGDALAIGDAWTTDGGQTWKHGTLPGVTKATGGSFDRVTDPTVATGPDGSVYVGMDAATDAGCGASMLVSRSTDHGATFGHPVTVESDACPLFPDKDWLAVDSSPTSPHYGRVYLFFDQEHGDPSQYEFPTVERWSDDHGHTWSPLVNVTTLATDTIGSQPVIEADGTIVDVMVRYTNQEKQSSIIAVTSHDGGATFSAPVQIAKDAWYNDADIRPGDLPSAALDASTGRIYVAFEQARTSGDGFNNILLSTSSDKGHTWSTARRVNPDAQTSGLDHFTPEVAVRGGEVVVTYRTRQHGGTPSNFVNMAYEVSVDSGAHFTAATNLGPASDLRNAAVAPVPFYGDYDGLAASATGFIAAWNVSSPLSAGSTVKHQTTWAAVLTR
jgi:hypothetical protein